MDNVKQTTEVDTEATKRKIESLKEMSQLTGVPEAILGKTMSGDWRFRLLRDAVTGVRVWIYFSSEVDLDEDGNPVSPLKFDIRDWNDEMLVTTNLPFRPYRGMDAQILWVQRIERNEKIINLRVCEPKDARFLLVLTEGCTVPEGTLFADKVQIFTSGVDYSELGDKDGECFSPLVEYSEHLAWVLMPLGFQAVAYTKADDDWVIARAKELEVEIKRQDNLIATETIDEIFWTEKEERLRKYRSAAQVEYEEWREECYRIRVKRKEIVKRRDELLLRLENLQMRLAALNKAAARRVDLEDMVINPDCKDDWWNSLHFYHEERTWDGQDLRYGFYWLGYRYDYLERDISKVENDIKILECLTGLEYKAMIGEKAIVSIAHAHWARCMYYHGDELIAAEQVPWPYSGLLVEFHDNGVRLRRDFGDPDNMPLLGAFSYEDSEGFYTAIDREYHKIGTLSCVICDKLERLDEVISQKLRRWRS